MPFEAIPLLFFYLFTSVFSGAKCSIAAVSSGLPPLFHSMEFLLPAFLRTADPGFLFFQENSFCAFLIHRFYRLYGKDSAVLRLFHPDFDSVKDYVSVDYYLPPESEDEEFTLRFPEYTKFVSQMFETKEEAMEEKRVTDIICTKCHRMLRKKIRWFSSGQRYYLCLATCPEHGMMKGKIRMKKSDDGRVFAVKTVKPVDEEGAEAVFLKKEEARIRRAEKSRQKKLHGVE